MYERQPCFPNDSYQLAYQHTRPLDCAGHHRSSYPFNVVSGKHKMSGGKKEHFDSKIQVEASLGFRGSVAADMEFNQTADRPSVNTASVLDSAFYSSQAADSTWEAEALENSKRSSSNFSCEVVNKRARQANQAEKLQHFAGNSPASITSDGKLSLEEPEWKRAAAGIVADGKIPAASNLSLPWLTLNTREVDTRLDQPARLSFYLGYEDDCQRTGFDQMEDIYSSFSIHSHWRLVSIGTNHQADLPEWTPQHYENLGSQSGLCENSALSNATTSFADLENTEASTDKWLGTCVMPMPNPDRMTMGARSCCSKIGCDCSDEGSIRCVRQHVNEAREKLSEALGQEKFIEIGFSDMGEVVAQRWTEEEENLFHEIVLSNPASLGRNFWIVLPRAFPSRSVKELVSYYFNVFMLRKRADQNRFDPLNVDSDNDAWQESSDEEFAMSEDWEEEDESAVESPDEDGLALNINVSEELDFHDEVDDEEEYKENFIGTKKNEGFCCGSDGCKEYESMTVIQPSGRNSTDCAEEQDVEDNSCTSYEGLHNLYDSCHGNGDGFCRQGNCLERDQRNLPAEYRNDDNISLADYEHIEGHPNSKPWKVSYVGSSFNDIDFFPTSNVLEEVFGKESWKKDGSGFS